MEALDRYIANMTQSAASDVNDYRRNSFPTEDPSSAYSIFKRVMLNTDDYPALKNLEGLQRCKTNGKQQQTNTKLNWFANGDGEQ